MKATDIRRGHVIFFEGQPCRVMEFTHRTPGNLRGFVQAKMRNLRSGTMTENRFSSEDKVEKAIMEDHVMEYLYDDGEYYYFMNIETYEQIHLMKDLLGDATPVEVAKYRKPDSLDARKLTLGEEVAAALVNIGKSSTDALIKTLITSPEPHARENAAWALGALHRRQLI